MGTLTKTQIAVVQLISEGKTAKDIAKMRYRSIGTIKKHIEQARERMGARNVANLVALALKQGLIHSVVLALIIASAAQLDTERRRVRLTRSFSISAGRVIRHEV